MDDINHNITEYIENGEYFKDAKQWYLNKYVNPAVQRSILMLIAGVLLFILLYAGGILYNLFPLSSQVPIILRLENTIDNVPILNKVGVDFESPAVSIAKHLVKNYVVAREAYIYDDLEAQINKVKNLSSKYVFKKFYNNLSLDNPNSSVLLYQRNIKRSVEVLNVKLGTQEKTLLVKFKAKTFDVRTSEEHFSDWVASVTYDMSEISLILEKKAQLDFIITDYNVQQLN